MQTVQNVTEVASSLDQVMASIAAGKEAEQALRHAAAEEITNDLIINADFAEWIETYEGPKFDVIHCDLPYGINYSGSRTRRTGTAHVAPRYADSPDVFWALLDAFLANQDRVAFPTAHCLFWFDFRHYGGIIESFEAAGWKLSTANPLIWTKGYQGIASDTKRRPRHCYEPALLFSRGDRQIIKLDKDHFEATIDEVKLHINQKPLIMLKHFLGLLVDEHTAVLDPTCGSGTSLAAASQLGCNRFLGVELDKSNADIARHILQRHADLEAKSE